MERKPMDKEALIEEFKLLQKDFDGIRTEVENMSFNINAFIERIEEELNR